MRVVGWNVRSLRDGRAGVVAVVRRLDPDVLVLQEAPRLVLWRLSRWWLARACGLRLATRGWAAGNAVLVRPGVHVVAASEVRAPRVPGLHRRGAAVAELVVGGQRLAVAGTHLDLEPVARLATARLVRAALPEGPAVLAADVNDVPGSAAWLALAEGLHDPLAGGPPTFPAGRPTRRIDALLVRGLEVVRAEVVDVAGASDHRAVVLDLQPR
jgi:endonuclease/exonuclease/phosphatase family metal-dependent hydrolase